MSRAPYDPQLEMLDEMRAIRETLDRIALALEGRPRPPEPDPNEQWDQANELWNEARKMALAAYYTLEEDHHPPEETTLAIEVCTGNLCPECAGPFLEPDDPDDPRRPAG